MRRLSAGLLFAILAGSASAQPKAEIVSIAKIWDQGQHNAFTDLVRWRERWWCVFREAEGHVGGDGKLRVLESTDGKAWRSAALLAEDGIDLRDPHFSVTPDDRLMIVAGGSVYRGTKTIMGRQPRVAFSRDGREWTPTARVLGEGEWLWRVTWHNGRAYGAAYRSTKDESEWALRLVSSATGEKWDEVTPLKVTGRPNETTLRFEPDGTMLAMVRREGGNTFGWIGRSTAPYADWTWHETKHRFGGPNFIALPDGRWVASSRSYPGGAKTVLGAFGKNQYEPFLTIPSGGDTSYAGLVWHEGHLWVSYYSSHEKKSSIYLAVVRLP